LQFYKSGVLGDKEYKYYPRGSWPQQGPEWIIWHGEGGAPPMAELTDGVGNQYGFTKAFPSAPQSGMSWFIFHNRSR
jgi:hypothetical protein